MYIYIQAFKLQSRNTDVSGLGSYDPYILHTSWESGW